MSSVLQVADRCAWVERDGTVYAAALPDGPPLVLDGSGAQVWLELVEGGSIGEVVERVAARAGESPELVAPGVTAFVEGLVAAGVLVAGPPAGRG